MKLLLIDDDINLCKVLAYQLNRIGYEVETANSGTAGLSAFRSGQYDLVISDIQMPDMNGLEVLRSIREVNNQSVVLIISAHGSVETALEACAAGADDYLTKPFSIEQLQFTIEKAVRFRRLQIENIRLKRELHGRYGFENLVGNSAAISRVIELARRVADSDSTVLITGESGTGKELIARGIHYNSSRKQHPLVVVNCPSISEHLLESELFGHVRGAFTGALKDRVGRFEEADGGTLFLDEIGELRGELQAKLLRVLQEHEITRVGENRSRKVNVRILAATNRELEQMVREGSFRQDLYYRLAVVPIRMPALRERREDIPLLVRHFAIRHNKEIELTAEYLNEIEKLDWPGNIRELENFVERTIVLARGNKLTRQVLLETRELSFSGPQTLSTDDSLAGIERAAIERALFECKGNRTHAAQKLKIPRHILLYRLKKYNIS
jgi:DNA-binding NtrC family response regulator